MGAWLGLCSKADDMFYWIDDTPLAGQYSSWDSGEPHYSYEKCVHIYNVLNKPGKWNNLRCNLDGADKDDVPVVICQKEHI